MRGLIRAFINAIFKRSYRPKRYERERFLLPTEWYRLKTVLDHQPPKIRIYFYLLLLEGPRMSEARTMQWSHVDLASGLWYKPRTKTGRSQTLALSAHTCTLLAQLPRTEPYLFPGEWPTQPWSRTAVEYHWRKVRRLAHVPDVQIRDLRRTCASWLAMQGASTLIIQNVLNHSSLAVTQVYARLNQDAVRAALDRHSKKLLEAGV